MEEFERPQELYVPAFVRERMKSASEEEILKATENLRQLLSICATAILRQQEEQEERERNRCRELRLLNEGEGQVGLS